MMTILCQAVAYSASTCFGLVFCFVLFETGSLVAQAGYITKNSPEFMTHLLPPPMCWDYKHVLPCSAV